MNTKEIYESLKHYNCFIGVFPLDLLPNVTQLPAALVVNTDKAHEPGEHWIAIYLKTNGKGQYFDSFGMPPFKEELIDFMELNCPKGWTHNKIMFQNILGITCGHYCVLFIKLRCRKYSYKDFTLLFTNVTRINDEVVQHLYKALDKMDKLPEAKGQFRYQRLECEETSPKKKFNLPKFFYSKKDDKKLLDGKSFCDDRRSGLRK